MFIFIKRLMSLWYQLQSSNNTGRTLVVVFGSSVILWAHIQWTLVLFPWWMAHYSHLRLSLSSQVIPGEWLLTTWAEPQMDSQHELRKASWPWKEPGAVFMKKGWNCNGCGVMLGYTVWCGCGESQGVTTKRGTGGTSDTLIFWIPAILTSAVLSLLGALHELLISLKSNQRGFLLLATRRVRHKQTSKSFSE